MKAVCIYEWIYQYVKNTFMWSPLQLVINRTKSLTQKKIEPKKFLNISSRFKYLLATRYDRTLIYTWYYKFICIPYLDIKLIPVLWWFMINTSPQGFGILCINCVQNLLAIVRQRYFSWTMYHNSVSHLLFMRTFETQRCHHHHHHHHQLLMTLQRAKQQKLW